MEDNTEKTTELQMTVEEIVRSYREAKDKAAQVQILANLNVCSKETIRRALVEGVRPEAASACAA